jgi:hypothetical protein
LPQRAGVVVIGHEDGSNRVDRARQDVLPRARVVGRPPFGKPRPHPFAGTLDDCRLVHEPVCDGAVKREASLFREAMGIHDCSI